MWNYNCNGNTGRCIVSTGQKTPKKNLGRNRNGNTGQKQKRKHGAKTVTETLGRNSNGNTGDDQEDTGFKSYRNDSYSIQNLSKLSLVWWEWCEIYSQKLYILKSLNERPALPPIGWTVSRLDRNSIERIEDAQNESGLVWYRMEKEASKTRLGEIVSLRQKTLIKRLESNSIERAEDSQEVTGFRQYQGQKMSKKRLGSNTIERTKDVGISVGKK